MKPVALHDESHALLVGDHDMNPPGVGVIDLLREDFATHDRDWLAPGFWAVAWHRVGNWRMGRPKWLRAPLTFVYRAGHHGVIALWGIDLPYNVKIGRRLRLGHHGCVLLGAREIGDDVVIQHAVTIGLRHRGTRAFPIIGNRVEIGAGACIVGGVSVGDDCYIGPNTVIVSNVKAGSSVLGIPPRALRLHERDGS
jgi:serine O-acetyltransferase